jgi:hypothetical protein
MKSKSNIRLWFVLGILCLGLAQGLWAQSSNIGCGYFSNPKPAASLKPASLQLVSNSDSDSASIVGLWNFTFVSEGNPGIPDGTVIDAGYAAWHSDGTEIINSGAHAPMTGNFCMGVWKQTKHSTFKLNHFALPWDPTGTFFVGPANLKEEVVLDRSKNSYSGTFTIDQYDTNGNLLAHIAGTTSAQRVTVD